MDAHELIFPEDREQVEAEIQRCKIDRGPFQTVFRVRKPSGEVAILLYRGRFMISPFSGREIYSGIAFDITEQHEREQSFGILQDRLDASQEAAGVGSWEWNLLERSIWWSDKTYQIHGHTPESITPAEHSIRDLIHPDDIESTAISIERCISEKRSIFRSTYRMKNAKGEYRWFLAIGRMEYSKDGVPLTVRGTDQDITERREVESRVQQLEKMESLGLLAGGIAHDFNNLLVGVLGNTALMLKNENLGPHYRNRLELIEDAANRAAQLTRQMLAYAGRGQQQSEQVDISELIQDMSKLLSASIAKKARLHFKLALHPNRVKGDPSQFSQIVLNLVINASDALEGESGDITIETSVIRLTREELSNTLIDEQLPSGSYLRLRVSDTGSGMSSDVQRRVFDPFFSTKSKGHGLGLAAVLGIVRGHRGAIKVESAPGKGCAIQVLLPCEDASVHEALREALPMKSEPTPSAASSGGRALVIDDEEFVREVAVAMLESFGMSVDSAFDGQDGLERYLAANGEYDLLLVDMNMPRMGGDEVFLKVRAAHPDQHVVLMSGYNRQEALASMQDQSGVAFLQKPFNLAALEQAIEAATASEG